MKIGCLSFVHQCRVSRVVKRRDISGKKKKRKKKRGGGGGGRSLALSVKIYRSFLVNVCRPFRLTRVINSFDVGENYFWQSDNLPCPWKLVDLSSLHVRHLKSITSYFLSQSWAERTPGSDTLRGYNLSVGVLHPAFIHYAYWCWARPQTLHETRLLYFLSIRESLKLGTFPTSTVLWTALQSQGAISYLHPSALENVFW